MPNEQISDFTEGTDLAATDELVAVDKSDTADAATGTTKRYKWLTVITKMFASRFAADAGSTDTYAATLDPAPTAYITGEHYRFKANTANTGACTINFNGLGAKTIKKAAGGITTDLADNDIRVGQWVDLVYDGTNMQMQSLLGNAPAGGAGGIGDVVGPGSATDNALVRFDTTTGKLVQNSTVILDDTGALTVPEMSAPATPAANKVAVYAKSDGLLYSKDDAGVETLVSGGADGGSIAPLVIEDANTVSQRNGTTAQITRIFKSFVSVTEYQRLKIDCGHADGIRLVAEALNATGINLLLGNSGSANSVLIGSGDMWPTTSRTYNLGGSSNLWNQVYGFIFISNNASDTSGGGFSFSGGPDMYRTASGAMEIRDPTGAFNKVHLGLGQANVNVALVKPASVQYIESRTGDETAFVYHVSAGGKFTSAQFDKTNTTLADVTGLTSEALTAGRTYGFEALLFVDADVVGGSKYAIAGTATATAIKYEVVFISDSANSMVITSRQTALGGSAGQAGTTAGICRISGAITVNAAGTLTVQFAQNAANGTSSVLTMSNFRVWQMN